ncbi:MAG: hypothetical protein K0S07_28 [Chlamydiales bacterium]|jgi:hypothetical protein|nr:hypothetical protein [Chlamydiales bacterium]
MNKINEHLNFFLDTVEKNHAGDTVGSDLLSNLAGGGGGGSLVGGTLNLHVQGNFDGNECCNGCCSGWNFGKDTGVEEVQKVSLTNSQGSSITVKYEPKSPFILGLDGIPLSSLEDIEAADRTDLIHTIRCIYRDLIAQSNRHMVSLLENKTGISLFSKYQEAQKRRPLQQRQWVSLKEASQGIEHLAGCIEELVENYILIKKNGVKADKAPAAYLLQTQIRKERIDRSILKILHKLLVPSLQVPLTLNECVLTACNLKKGEANHLIHTANVIQEMLNEERHTAKKQPLALSNLALFDESVCAVKQKKGFLKKEGPSLFTIEVESADRADSEQAEACDQAVLFREDGCWHPEETMRKAAKGLLESEQTRTLELYRQAALSVYYKAAVNSSTPAIFLLAQSLTRIHLFDLFFAKKEILLSQVLNLKEQIERLEPLQEKLEFLLENAHFFDPNQQLEEDAPPEMSALTKALQCVTTPRAAASSSLSSSSSAIQERHRYRSIGDVGKEGPTPLVSPSMFWAMLSIISKSPSEISHFELDKGSKEQYLLKRQAYNFISLVEKIELSPLKKFDVASSQKLGKSQGKEGKNKGKERV